MARYGRVKICARPASVLDTLHRVSPAVVDRLPDHLEDVKSLHGVKRVPSEGGARRTREIVVIEVF